jgi:hypothetical protein
VESQMPPTIADGVRQALASPELGPRARERVLREFPLEKRRDKLFELIDSLE